MRWIDGSIDRMRERVTPVLRPFSSFSRVGGVFNVLVCGVIVVGALTIGFSQSPFGFLVAVGAVAMEVLFVRILVRAYSGDFDRD